MNINKIFLTFRIDKEEGLYGFPEGKLAGLKTPFFSTQGFDLAENCPGMVSKGNQTRAGLTSSILAGLFWTSSNPYTPSSFRSSRSEKKQPSFGNT